MSRGSSRLRGLVPGVLGALLLIAAALLPSVVVPALERVPDDPDATTTLMARGATFLDIDSRRPVVVDLVLTTRTTQWRGGQESPEGVVQWVSTSAITSSDGVLRSETWDVAAFDARTGRASGCCEGFRVDDTGRSVAVDRAGQVLKMPFRTEPRDIEVWDPALGDTVTARYEGEDEVDGVRAYRFTTSVPPTVVGTVEVPASLVGLQSIRPVTVEQVYAGGRTMWVEPATGGLLDLEQRVRQTWRHDGEETGVLEATFELSDESRAEAVEQLGRGAQLTALRTTVPIVLAVAGALLLLLGVRRRLSRRTS